jgi:hypothetical protein
MGKPGRGNLCQHVVNHSCMWGTRGTETSKYPEEEKENLSISKVAASEMEGAQTVVRASRGSDCDMRDVR